MLTGKQKRFLRSRANTLKPIFQVGKQGVGENMLVQLDEALEARELIKISVLRSVDESANSIGEIFAQSLQAELVQVIGNTIVLYRESEEKKQIILP